jgi:hypothetical protein
MRTTPPRAGASAAPSAPDAHVEHGIQMICAGGSPSTGKPGDARRRPAQQRAQRVRCAVGGVV